MRKESLPGSSLRRVVVSLWFANVRPAYQSTLRTTPTTTPNTLACLT